MTRVKTGLNHYRIDTDALAYAMRRKGMEGYGKLSALGIRAGVTPTAIGKWLAGEVQNPQISAVMQVAKVLDVDVEDLMEEVEW